MNLLKRKGRLFLELGGLLYGGLMILLAIVEWAGKYTWHLAPSSLLTMAGVSYIVVIYLVLDEIRLNTRH
jgi:hypothetical protein